LTADTSFLISERGYYGQFGGAYIPEMLYPNVETLRQSYLGFIEDPSFQQEFHELLQQFAGRPTPLYLAKRLSEQYGHQVYLKREDLCHTGAHKINNTIGQILIARRLGKDKIVAETGAGQHGVATATVCALAGMECTIYMGAVDMERQQPNVARMKMLGAKVVAATSGNQTLKDATNEAMRHWINHPVDTHYIIGSVVGPHPYPDMVARFQSVISAEIRQQLENQTGKPDPDVVIACVGGGSNAAGAFYHFLGRLSVKLVAVEAGGMGIHSGHSAATVALGKTGILHGSKTLLMQNEDGQVTEPYSISAGLDYPGIGPLHAHLFESGRAYFHSITDAQAMEAGLLLSRLEGIIPAIETAHALAYLPYLEGNAGQRVVISLSGRGDKDLDTYRKWMEEPLSPH
jgi:tryptophan synthase beta chain